MQTDVETFKIEINYFDESLKDLNQFKWCFESNRLLMIKKIGLEDEYPY